MWRILFHQDARAAYLGHEAYGAAIRPPRQEEVPSLRWLAYGSSITYGANTQHPATSYVQQAARRLGVDVLNLGLPGSCMAEPAMAEYLASRTDVELVTCELGVNMTGWIEPAEFERRVRHLLMTISAPSDRCPTQTVQVFRPGGTATVTASLDQGLFPSRWACTRRNGSWFSATDTRESPAVQHRNPRRPRLRLRGRRNDRLLHGRRRRRRSGP